MPFISITCANCGNTYFLYAIVAGNVKPDRKGGELVNNVSPKTIPVSQEFEVRSPVSEKAFTVADSDWSYLHKKISQITAGEFAYHTAGSVALGVAGSAFIGAITFPAVLKYTGYKATYYVGYSSDFLGFVA